MRKRDVIFMYITVKQAAEKWGISDRRVRVLCAEGKILGVTREGRSWMIPADAKKPEDGQFKATDSLLTSIRIRAWPDPRQRFGKYGTFHTAKGKNDILVAQRQKHNGMSWSKHGSSVLAAIEMVY